MLAQFYGETSKEISTWNIKNNIRVMYCIVVGSRRIMPADALQPKAYCTNPGL